MSRRSTTDSEDTLIGLLILICMVGFACAAFADGCDWLDRRSCRVNGGTVQKLDKSEWRCTGVTPEAR